MGRQGRYKRLSELDKVVGLHKFRGRPSFENRYVPDESDINIDNEGKGGIRGFLSWIR